MNVTPENVLWLLRKTLELKGTERESFMVVPQRGYMHRSVTVGDIHIVEWVGGDITVMFKGASAYCFDYRRQTDRIILVSPGSERYLVDVVAQISEILPLDALAAIE